MVSDVSPPSGAGAAPPSQSLLLLPTHRALNTGPSHGESLEDIVRHIIQRTFNTRFISYLTSDDLESNIRGMTPVAGFRV